MKAAISILAAILIFIAITCLGGLIGSIIGNLIGESVLKNKEPVFQTLIGFIGGCIFGGALGVILGGAAFRKLRS